MVIYVWASIIGILTFISGYFFGLTKGRKENSYKKYLLNWLFKRIKETKKEYDSFLDEINKYSKSAKGGKLKALKEISDYIETH
jgi:hypothetical protein